MTMHTCEVLRVLEGVAEGALVLSRPLVASDQVVQVHEVEGIVAVGPHPVDLAHPDALPVLRGVVVGHLCF